MFITVDNLKRMKCSKKRFHSFHRSDRHNRRINEFLSLDIEMGYHYQHFLVTFIFNGMKLIYQKKCFLRFFAFFLRFLRFFAIFCVFFTIFCDFLRFFRKKSQKIVKKTQKIAKNRKKTQKIAKIAKIVKKTDISI